VAASTTANGLDGHAQTPHRGDTTRRGRSNESTSPSACGALGECRADEARTAFAVLAARGLEPDLAIARPFLLNARESVGDAAWEAGVSKGNAIDLDTAASLAAELDHAQTAHFRSEAPDRD
jgi:hypothetical protein